MDGEDLSLFGFFLTLVTLLLISDSSQWKMPLFVTGVVCMVLGIVIAAWERTRQ